LLIQACERGEEFRFEKKTNPEMSIKGRLKCPDEQLAHLIETMVKWSPEERVEAVEALKHPFILDGLPKQVRNEHIKQMNS
jgi:hypothetical protein